MPYEKVDYNLGVPPYIDDPVELDRKEEALRQGVEAYERTLYTHTSQANMLAQTGAKIGDKSLRTDTTPDLVFELRALPASTLANWKLIGTLAQTAADIGAAAASHQHNASDVNAGTLAPNRLASGTPGPGKYVDGGTGNWTDLPTSSAVGFSSGDIKQSARITAETGWYLCDATAKDRTADVNLFEAITFQITGAGVTNGSPTVTVPDASSIGPGMPVEGLGLVTGVTVLSKVGNTLTLSANWTAATNANATLRFLPFGQGNGTTTFNIPGARGRAIIGVGAGGGGLTQRYMGDKSGAETHTLSATEIPAHTHPLSYGRQNDISAGGARTLSNLETSTQSTSTGNNSGGGGAHNNMPPYLGLNFFIKR